jgi:hypothetical protein
MSSVQGGEQVWNSVDHWPLDQLRDVHRAAHKVESLALDLLGSGCFPRPKILIITHKLSFNYYFILSFTMSKEMNNI